MSSPCRRVPVFAALAAASVISLGAQSSPERAGVFASAWFHDAQAVSESSAAVDALIAAGRLELVGVEPDPSDPERRFEYHVLRVGEAPVHGGSVTRVVRGVASDLVIGSLPSLDTHLPRLQGEVASASASGWRGWRSACGAVAAEQDASLVDVQGLSPDFGLPLVVYLPPAAPPAAAWRCYLGDGVAYFVSAAGPPVVLGADDMVVSQDGRTAVGSGVGLAGDVKNVFTTLDSSGFGSFGFLAEDRVREPGVVLLDAAFNGNRLGRFLERPIEGVQRRFIARDGDNVWPSEIVDAHAHLGWTYDYLVERFGWRGFDGHDARIVGIVNAPKRGAFFYLPPYGPEGGGAVVLGRSDARPFVQLDIVAHELGHSVVAYSVQRRTGFPDFWTSSFRLGRPVYQAAVGRPWRCDEVAVRWVSDGDVVARGSLHCPDDRFALWSDEGGAVHEAYADIFALSAARHAAGRGAPVSVDWVLDGPGGRPVRSVSSPHVVPVGFGNLGHAATYGQRYQLAVACVGSCDARFPVLRPVPLYIRGGHVVSHAEAVPVLDVDAAYLKRLPYGAVHWNSTILSRAFHLAVEGSGQVGAESYVMGVGDAHREAVERIWFHALRRFFPNNLDLPRASAAIHQAARELTSDPPRGADLYEAVSGGLAAVGLPLSPR
ncbi:MAG: M4 family metallopeptidase [Acidobacteria bacterium]|nr:M4 family metallopeptidase [Acidobacteriota bacterium]